MIAKKVAGRFMAKGTISVGLQKDQYRVELKTIADTASLEGGML